jgi:hypothetical protein
LCAAARARAILVAIALLLWILSIVATLVYCRPSTVLPPGGP